MPVLGNGNDSNSLPVGPSPHKHHYDSHFRSLLQGQARLESGLEGLQTALTELRSSIVAARQDDRGSTGFIDIDHAHGDLDPGMRRRLSSNHSRCSSSNSSCSATASGVVGVEELPQLLSNDHLPSMDPSRDGSHDPTTGGRPFLRDIAPDGVVPAAAGEDAGVRRGSRLGAAPHADFAEHALYMHQNLDAVSKQWGQASLYRSFVLRKGSLRVHSTHRFRVPGKGWLKFLGWLPFHPLSLVPTVFDCASAVVLLSDIVLVPVVIAWDMRPTGWMRDLAIFTLTFWTCDILRKFCTGFMVGASVVRDWRMVAQRYIKQSFVLDLMVAVIDGFELVYAEATKKESASGLKFVRLLRFMKITRLIRLSTRLNGSVGMTQIGAMLSAWIVRNFGAFSSIVHWISLASILMRLLFLVFGLGHLMACTWYFLLLQVTPSDANDGWRTLVPELGDVEMYLYGLYWSLSSTFAGNSIYPPVLTWEIVFSAVLLVMGTLFVTSFTSTLAATLIEGQQAQLETNKQLGSLVRFLEQEGFTGLLLMAAHGDFVTRMSSSNMRLTEEDVQEQLTMLSTDLQTLIRERQYSTSFQKVPILRLIHVLHQDLIQELCLVATFSLERPGHLVIQAHQSVTSVTLLLRGRALYTHHRRASIGGLESGGGEAAAGDEERSESRSVEVAGRGEEANCVAMLAHHWERVAGEAWISEVALLFTWKAMGTLELEGSCELLLLSVDAFIKAVVKAPDVLALVSSFCEQNFIHCSSMMASNPLAAVSDINGQPDSDFIVAEMPAIVRQELVSGPALDLLRDEWGGLKGLLKVNAMSDLEDEVREGKCHLTITETGAIQRVVKMAVLHLEDEDGLMCLQLAEGDRLNSGSLKVKLGMVGHKLVEGQSARSAIEAVIADSFGALASSIEILGTADVPIIEYEQSKSFGITTKYIKIVIRAVLRGSMSMAGVEVATLGHVGPSTQALQAGIGRGRSWVFGKATTGAHDPPTIFAVASKRDHRYMVLAWYTKSDFEQRVRDRAMEAASVKVWLALSSTQRVQSLADWTLTTADGTFSSQQMDGLVASAPRSAAATRPSHSHLSEDGIEIASRSPSGNGSVWFV